MLHLPERQDAVLEATSVEGGGGSSSKSSNSISTSSNGISSASGDSCVGSVSEGVSESSSASLSAESAVDVRLFNQLAVTNVAGFLIILSVDIEKDMLVVKAPCPVTMASLPSKYFLLGSLKYEP